MVGGDWYTKRNELESGPLTEPQVKAFLYSTLDLRAVYIRQGNSAWVDARLVLERFVALERNGVYLLYKANVYGPFTTARANELLANSFQASSYRFGATGEWKTFGDRRTVNIDATTSGGISHYTTAAITEVGDEKTPFSNNIRVYIRFKGRVLGPLTKEKAGKMLARGQITRQHEVSTDRISWRSVSEVEDFFPNPRANVRNRSAPSNGSLRKSTSSLNASVDIDHAPADSTFNDQNGFPKKRRVFRFFEHAISRISSGREIVARKSASCLNSVKNFMTTCFAIGFGIFVLLPTVIVVVGLAIGGIGLVDNVNDFVNQINLNQWSARTELLFMRSDETTAVDGWLHAFSRHPQPILKHLSAGDEVWHLKDFKFPIDGDVNKRELYVVLAAEGVKTVVLKSEERVDNAFSETNYETGWIRFLDPGENDSFDATAQRTEDGFQVILTHDFHEVIAGNESLVITYSAQTTIDVTTEKANTTCSWHANENRKGQAGRYPMPNSNLTVNGEGVRLMP